MNLYAAEHLNYDRWLEAHAPMRRHILNWLSADTEAEPISTPADVRRVLASAGGTVSVTSRSLDNRFIAVVIRPESAPEELWLSRPGMEPVCVLRGVLARAGLAWSPDGRSVLACQTDQTGRSASVVRVSTDRPYTLTICHSATDSKCELAVRASSDAGFALIVSVSWRGRQYRMIDWESPFPQAIPGDGWVLAEVHRAVLLTVVECSDDALCRGYEVSDGGIGQPEFEITLPGCRAADFVSGRPGQLFVFGRDGSASALWMVDIRNGLARKVDPPKGAPRWGYFEPYRGRSTGAVCTYSSLNRPEVSYAVDSAGNLSDIAPPASPDPVDGVVVRLSAAGSDGTLIPVTICLPSTPCVAPTPLLLLTYGCYGISLPLRYAWTRRLLLASGVGFGVAHLRGGGDLGRDWHAAAMGATKHRSVDDLIAVIDGLNAQRITSSARLAVRTFSAGALVVAEALRRRPSLCRAVVFDAPHFDPETKRLPTDVPEFGVPDEQRLTMRDLPAGVYPASLTLLGGRDMAVDNAATLGFIEQLRRNDRSARSQHLVRFDADRGHGGSPDRRAADEALADVYLFVLDQLVRRP